MGAVSSVRSRPSSPRTWSAPRISRSCCARIHYRSCEFPDLVVVRGDSPLKRASAADVLIAVEIISPGTRNVDLHLKSFEYADAGIPHYWVVDLDPPAPSITVFGLGAPGEGYRESQTAIGELLVTEPFPLSVDISALVSRGR